MGRRKWESSYAARMLAWAWRTMPHTCGICGQEITRGPGARLADGRPDPRRASVDHVVPRSRGGSDDPANLRLAHFRCNSAKGARVSTWQQVTDSREWFGVSTPPPAGGREVWMIFGPPGAGKTTLARDLAAARGLCVYDMDDPQWRGQGTAFTVAMAEAGEDEGARAVFIRSGATRRARASVEALVKPTHTRLVNPGREVCRDRVIERNRPYPPLRRQLAAVEHWFAVFEP